MSLARLLLVSLAASERPAEVFGRLGDWATDVAFARSKGLDLDSEPEIRTIRISRERG